MALATAFNRSVGYLAMRLVPVDAARAAGAGLSAGSGAGGVAGAGSGAWRPAMLGGLAAAFVAAKLTRSDFAAVLAAMAVAAAMRAVGLG